jgi:hypothetical protein
MKSGSAITNIVILVAFYIFSYAFSESILISSIFGLTGMVLMVGSAVITKISQFQEDCNFGIGYSIIALSSKVGEINDTLKLSAVHMSEIKTDLSTVQSDVDTLMNDISLLQGDVSTIERWDFGQE